MIILTVTDLHRVQRLYQLLGEAVIVHRPDVLALGGDFLDFQGSVVPQKSSMDCATFIAGLDVPEIVFVRSNHEDAEWWNFQEAWMKTARKLTKLHGEAAVLGPAVLVGFPCQLGDDLAFTADKEPLPANHASWLSRLLREHGPAIRTLWLMHEPPVSANAKSSDDLILGNRIWTELIERFSPLLAISGHGHATPIKTDRWFRRLGDTVSVNVGQSESGPLHYTVIEAEFGRQIPCLPSRMSVRAYPGGEPLEIIQNRK